MRKYNISKEQLLYTALVAFSGVFLALSGDLKGNDSLDDVDRTIDISSEPLQEDSSENSLEKERSRYTRSGAEDEALPDLEAEDEDVNQDPDYLLRDHPLQEEPLEEKLVE